MQFHRVPHLPFNPNQLADLEPDALVRIQPDEGITLRFGAKVPGQAFRVRSVSMDFFYGAAFLEETPRPTSASSSTPWSATPPCSSAPTRSSRPGASSTPLQAWENDEAPLARYEAGTWGPEEADRLMEADGRRWRRP